MQFSVHWNSTTNKFVCSLNGLMKTTPSTCEVEGGRGLGICGGEGGRERGSSIYLYYVSVGLTKPFSGGNCIRQLKEIDGMYMYMEHFPYK